MTLIRAGLNALRSDRFRVGRELWVGGERSLDLFGYGGASEHAGEYAHESDADLDR